MSDSKIEKGTKEKKKKKRRGKKENWLMEKEREFIGFKNVPPTAGFEMFMNASMAQMWDFFNFENW